MATQWYYAQNGEQKGPVSTEALCDMITTGQFSLDDLVWKTGLAEWVKASQVREFIQPAQIIAQAAPEPELRLVEPDEKPQDGTSQSQQEVSQYTPKQAKPQKQPQAAAWHLSRNGQQQGPFTAQMLKEMALAGELLPTDHLWKNGIKNWVEARSLPGLKFPAAAAPISGTANVNTIATDDPFGSFDTNTPDANSIFNVMSDPAFAVAPTSTAQTPNTALMSAATLNSKPQSRSRVEFEPLPTELAFLPIAFIGSFIVACVVAYGYGYIRHYIPYYIVWYFSIFMIGSLLSVMVCTFFEKARFNNTIVTVGYLLLLGAIVLYIAWATTITLMVNELPEEEGFDTIYMFQVLIRPQLVFQGALEISIHSESTSSRYGTTTSAFMYYLLEAVFITIAPLYTAYKRYNESD